MTKVKTILLLLASLALLCACAHKEAPTEPTAPTESTETPPACYAPWEVEPYKSGRAIPGSSPEAIIPICEYNK